jgi:MFS family permease
MAIAMSLGVGGLVVHFVPMFGDLGAHSIRAAQIASILGLSSVAGRIGVGMLLDRLPAPYVAFGTLIVAAFGILLLFVFGLEFAPLAVALVGLAAGAEVDLIAYLCSRQFGTRAYGTIYGWQYSVFVMGYGFSPFLVGLARDHFGNYEFALLASAGAVALAGLVAPMLRSEPQLDVALT